MRELWLMCRDERIARIVDNRIEIDNPALLPLQLARTADFDGWLSMRAVDSHRTNSRLLKKALRLEKKDDISTALHFNAATITDAYWVKPPDSELTYEDVRFKTNQFDMLALCGDADAFNQHPSRTPELTNTGSFEKCWRLIDGTWWMYKSENALERFFELFAYQLAKKLHIPAAIYELDGPYVRSRDFTDSASFNFESAYGIIGEDADERSIYDKLMRLDERVAKAFVQMSFFDALLFNMDRHEQNYGVLRDVATGEILGMAPLFDHNIALISRGYPRNLTRANDRLIHDFAVLVKERDTGFVLPRLTRDAVRSALALTQMQPPADEALAESPEKFVVDFIMNGYRQIQKLCPELPLQKSVPRHKTHER